MVLGLNEWDVVTAGFAGAGVLGRGGAEGRAVGSISCLCPSKCEGVPRVDNPQQDVICDALVKIQRHDNF